jgi:hypothetical protein
MGALMFDSCLNVDQAAFIVVALVAIAAISLLLRQAFDRSGAKPWPAFFVGMYNIVLLILFLFGIFTQERSEGFGFVPLFAFTTPWSWLIVWFSISSGLVDNVLTGTGLPGTFLWTFINCNILAASANSASLYLVLRRRQRKSAEDEAWERARRNR